MAGTYPPLAPVLNPSTGVNVFENQEPVILSAYPNPFLDRFVVQFNMFEDGPITIQLADITGKVIINTDLGSQPSGLNYLEVEAASAATGMYVVSIQTKSGVVYRRIMKSN